MRKQAVIMAILLLSVSIFATDVIKINKLRGEYEINFTNIYEIPIHTDIQTLISLPPGYRITLAMPGSPDFVSTTVVQNTVYLTRPVDHVVETNVALHVITPEGLEEKLVLRCVGPGRGGTKVLAVQFTQPNTSEMNRVIETIKARYSEQLAEELSIQEKELNKSVHKQTVGTARAFFVKAKRKGKQLAFKGADVVFDGMINSRDNTYIYATSSIPDDECKIISLEKITFKDKRTSTPELVMVTQLSEKEFLYCWSVPQIKIPKKPRKIKLIFKIWSEPQTMKIKIS